MPDDAVARLRLDRVAGQVGRRHTERLCVRALAPLVARRLLRSQAVVEGRAVRSRDGAKAAALAGEAVEVQRDLELSELAARKERKWIGQ